MCQILIYSILINASQSCFLFCFWCIIYSDILSAPSSHSTPITNVVYVLKVIHNVNALNQNSDNNCHNNINLHPIVTRAKAGVFKPKLYNSVVFGFFPKPYTVKEVLSSSSWFPKPSKAL